MDPVSVSFDDIVIDADAPEAHVKAAARDLKWREEVLSDPDIELDGDDLSDETREWLEEF